MDFPRDYSESQSWIGKRAGVFRNTRLYWTAEAKQIDDLHYERGYPKGVDMKMNNITSLSLHLPDCLRQLTPSGSMPTHARRGLATASRS